MLSPPLRSTYLQYKQDTDFVANWLVTTARACGYPADLLTDPNTPSQPTQPSKRLKGKARKQAKENNTCKRPQTATTTRPVFKKYVVAIKDFIPLANYIASRRPSVSVPDSFVAGLDKVIVIRSAFTSKFNEDATKPNPRADESHSYFVSILEKVRASLRLIMSTAASQAASAADSLQTLEEGKLENFFASLTVHEAVEANPAPVTKPANPAAPKPTLQDDIVYEAEPQTSSTDAMMAYYMLFNDLKKIQNEVRQIWATFQQGFFDAAAAAIATNTAVDLARNIIDEVLPILKGHSMYKLGSRLHAAFCVSQGYDLEAAIDAHRSNYVAYNLANYTYMNAYMLLESCLKVYDPNHLPLYKPGTFGYYDPTLDRSKLSGAEKFNEDQVLVLEMFTDLVTVGLIDNYPVHDKMMRGMKEALKTGQSPFYLVFATQIFLDIHHILREEVPDVAKHVINQISTIGETIGRHLEFHKDLKIDTWPASNDRELTGMIQKVHWIVEDPIHQIKIKNYARMKILPPESTQPNSMLRSSPVIAGLMLYHFRFELHDVGIAVANCWGSITYSWHLYNALKSEKLLSGIWKDMEIAYSLLGDSNIHVGHAPGNTDEYFKRFCLQMGISSSSFAKLRRQLKPGGLASRAGPRGISKVVPVYSMFADRYLRRKTQSVDWTPEHIDKILSHSTWQTEGSIEEGNLTMEPLSSTEQQKMMKKKKKHAKGELLRPEELIQPLAFALHAETLELAFPWLLMHRLCWEVLRGVKNGCHSQLVRTFTPAYMEKESQLPWMVGFIFMAAVGVDSGTRDMRPLQRAAASMNEYIERGSDILLRLLNVQLGLRVEFEDDDSDSEAV
ncbi:hypothetical protein QBC43DRAFT_201563 [Cladorrhinum sp. PSN259]|nr:hypothetical protein QBC43DRAFT_201563 [Cladorrhinum sp. PSN259]